MRTIVRAPRQRRAVGFRQFAAGREIANGAHVLLAHADRAGSWRAALGDLFDRMLAAPSDLERLPLVTNGAAIQVVGIEAVW